MAFWKKSDDPWDRKPGKQTTNWYENETPAVENPAAEDPVGAESGRPPERAAAAEKCPWCGGEMLMGHLDGGRDATIWREGERKGPWGLLFSDTTPRQMTIKESEPSWYCEKCGKLVVSASGLDLPIAQQKTSFHEYVDQWKAAEEKEGT